MKVRFWGTRGSIAKPGPANVRYGENTSCVELRGRDGLLIVLDCGTGAHHPGQPLMAAGSRCDGHLMRPLLPGEKGNDVRITWFNLRQARSSSQPAPLCIAAKNLAWPSRIAASASRLGSSDHSPAS